MVKKNFLLTVILSGLLMAISCAQDPIFYKISTETIPEKPRIPGAPTNMVVFNREYPDPDDDALTISVPIMYVASGGLHWYAKTDKGTGSNSRWDSGEYRIPQPGGKVICLAVTDKHLYALSISDSGVSTTLRRIGPTDTAWKRITISIDEPDGKNYTLIQSIYADKNSGWLFAGAMNNRGSDFGILYLDDTSDPDVPTLKLIISKTEMLSGAAKLDSNYYLSTRGKSVYKVPDVMDADSVEPLPELVRTKDGDGNVTYPPTPRNRLFMGMIQFRDNGPIIVVQRDGGAFFEVQETGFRLLRYINSEESVSTGRYSTGALALWQNINNEDEKMFLAGIQGGLYSSGTTTTTSYTHGYTEFEFKFEDDADWPGWLVLDSTRRSKGPTITVDGETDRYSATIGKHPINHMFQVPKEIDDKMIFFASTQTGGLWSYRDRSDGKQWNAEN